MTNGAEAAGWTGDSEEILFEITSPGFNTRYPELINPDLITSDALRAMERVGRRSWIGPQTMTAYLLKDVPQRS